MGRSSLGAVGPESPAVKASQDRDPSPRRSLGGSLREPGSVPLWGRSSIAGGHARDGIAIPQPAPVFFGMGGPLGGRRRQLSSLMPELLRENALIVKTGQLPSYHTRLSRRLSARSRPKARPAPARPSPAPAAAEAAVDANVDVSDDVDAMMAAYERREDAIRASFKKYDRDHSNAIDTAELGLLLRDLGLDTSKNSIERWLERYDTNKDGVISWSEFTPFYNAAVAQGQAQRKHAAK